jgi:hypothetical protein
MKMKLLARTLSLLIIASLTLFFANCGGDGGGSTPEEKVQLGKLKGTWEISTATLTMGSTVDRTGDFTGFTLQISGDFDSDSPEGPYSYQVGGTRPTPSPWPASGKWFFGDDPKTLLVRDEDNDNQLDTNGDDLAMFYSINSSNVLTISFTCESCDYAGSRTAQVDGLWEFVLTPQ